MLLLLLLLMLLHWLLLLLLHRHLHVASELLLLRWHAVWHLHSKAAELGLLLLLLLCHPHVGLVGRLFAHSARLAGIHGALHILGIAVHAVPERGIILMAIQLLLAIVAVVALVGVMAPTMIIAFVDADVVRSLVVVCSAATVQISSSSIPSLVIIVAAVPTIVVVVAVPTVGVLLIIIIPAAIVAIIVIAVVAIPLLLLLLVVRVYHHVSHLLLEASIYLLHLLIGISQTRDDRLGAVVCRTKLVHRIIKCFVLLHVCCRICGVHPEPEVTSTRVNITAHFY